MEVITIEPTTTRPRMSPPTRSESPIVLLVRRMLRAAMDALAFLGVAADRRALAIAADAVHDRSLAHLVYVAAVGAEEAQIRGCGCATRFDRVMLLGRGAQQADAIEDGHYDGAFTHVGHGARSIRLVAGSAERFITGGPA